MKLNARKYTNSVLKLLAGGASSAVLMLAAIPVLTRLYSPKEFGVFGLVWAFGLVFGNNSDLKLSLGALQLENREESLAVFKVSFLCSLLLSIVATLLFTLFGSFLSLDGVGIVLGAFLLCLFMGETVVLQHLHTWQKRYGFQSMAKVVGVAVTLVVQIVLSAREMGALGLVWGGVAGRGVQVTILLATMYFPMKEFFILRWASLYSGVKKCWGFVVFTLPGAVLNSAAVEAPVAILSAFFGLEVAGYFTLAKRILVAPVALVVQSIAPVFHREMADCRSAKRTSELFVFTLKKILRLSFLPAILGLFLAPLAHFILGADWKAAGLMIAILLPLNYAKLVVSPLNRTFMVLDRHQAGFIWQVTFCVLSNGALALVAYFSGSTMLALASLCLVGVFMYAVILRFNHGLCVANDRQVTA